MKIIKTKLCIVGSGVSGVLCAKYASERIDDILVLERGKMTTHQTRMEKGLAMELTPATEPHYQYPSYKKFTQNYSVGGCVNWFGNSLRLIPNDFRMHSEYGIMEDWLISYDDLEPFYCLAEKEMFVSGADDNPLIPRSQPYPLRAHEYSPNDKILQGCFPKGTFGHQPQARLSESLENRLQCCGSATCHLCPVDAKYTVLNSHYDTITGNRYIRLLPDHVAVEVLQDNKNTKNINAVLARDVSGNTVKIEADSVVLAANAFENASILLRSSSIKNHPLTGRFLADHTSFYVTIITRKKMYPNYGKTPITANGYHFYDGHWRRERAASLIEFWNPGWKHHKMIEYIIEKEGVFGKQLRQRMIHAYEHHFRMAFLLDITPNIENKVKLSSRKNKFGLPVSVAEYAEHDEYVLKSRDYILSVIPGVFSSVGVEDIITEPLSPDDSHILGTCKMGNYNDGVVDENLKHNYYDNLYVLGGSAFPTYSPAPPTLTIAALGVKLGTFLAANA